LASINLTDSQVDVWDWMGRGGG